jgi:hypothetical protein
MITINVQPSTIRPAYNELIYIVDSDKKAEANFSYVADVYLNNVKVDRLKVPAHPTFGRGVFDVSETVKDYIVSNFEYDAQAIIPSSGSVFVLGVKFGEEYGLSTSGTVIYPELATATLRQVFNGVFDPLEIDDYTGALYSTLNTSSRFLTNKTVRHIYKNEKDFLYMINRTADELYSVRVTVQNEGNPFDDVYLVRNFYSFFTTFQDLKQVIIPSGFNLNDIPGGHVTAVVGTLPILKSTAISYQIECVNSTPSAISQMANFTVSNYCGKYDKTRLFFLNKLGGYDGFTFTKRSRFSSNIERETYKQNKGRLTSHTVWNSLVANREETIYATNIDDTIVLNSEYLSSGDVVWLEEMVTSPDVRMEIGTKCIPVNVINSQFERKGYDKLYSLKLEVKPSYKRRR